MSDQLIVLIPAYEPGPSLLELIQALRKAAPDAGVVVVDDGSGPRYADLFRRAREQGADVLSHPVNWGKGRALKTGMAHILANYPGRDVVCADSDGQHRPDDVLRVAASIHSGQLGESDASMVLGARAFTGPVPLRSRIGNEATRRLFWLATGREITDTQTGLRAYPAAMLPALLEVPGERFEYELNLLLAASEHSGKGDRWPIEEVPIATVYLEHNASSHFRPLRDSARIYLPLATYAASALAAFVIDVVALLVLAALTRHLLVSVIGARLISATFNFAMNRRLVFDRAGETSIKQSARRYASLAVGILAANYALLWLLHIALGLPLLPAKLLTEGLLVGASYALQRHFVFHRESDPVVEPATTRVRR